MTTTETSSTHASPPLRDSHGQVFVDWCANFVVHGEGDLWGQPFELRPDQVLWAWQWFEVDDDGAWWYERGYLEEPKGAGKTMLLAAVALFELFGPLAPPHPNIPVAAAGHDQSLDDGIFRRCRQIVEHPNCPLREFAHVGYDKITRTDRPGQIRAIPANGATTDGGLPTLFLADEVQDWRFAAADAHERNENSTTKREAPVGRSLSASTPGQYAGDGSVGWRLHNYGSQVAKGTIDDERFLFVSHAADEAVLGKDDDGNFLLDDPGVLEQAIRDANYGASDRKVERLKRRYREIPRHRFCRFHLGLWVAADGVRWMDMAAYEKCVDADADIAHGEPIVAFFDGSVNDDSTGLVAMNAAGVAKVLGCWEKPEYGEGWLVPRDEVDAVVEDMFANFDVVKFACDPAHWRSELIDWVDRFGDDKVIEYPPTNARMAPACDQFLSDVQNAKVTLPDDARLFDHVRNAIGKRTNQGTTIRKEGPESPRKIDLAVCVVGANDARLRYLTTAYRPKNPTRYSVTSW